MGQRALVAALACVAVVAAGVAVAAPKDKGTVTACVKPGGQVRIVDKPSACRGQEDAESWNRQGRQGPVGPAGPVGAAGAQGPAGVADPRPVPAAVPVVSAGIANASGGGTILLSDSVTITDGRPHKILLTGGFTAVCNPCSFATVPSYRVTVSPPATPDTVVSRRLPLFAAGAGSPTEMSGSVNELVVSPAAGCAPCTYALVGAPATASPQDPAASRGTVDFTGVRFAVVDLGPMG